MSTLRPQIFGTVPLRERSNAPLAPSIRWLTRQAWRVADLILLWHQRARQRRQLACLSDRMLRDIGLTRADVFAESSKSFWRL
jgi:uncharacterized protein YjiS (DUF1127 family)